MERAFLKKRVRRGESEGEMETKRGGVAAHHKSMRRGSPQLRHTHTHIRYAFVRKLTSVSCSFSIVFLIVFWALISYSAALLFEARGCEAGWKTEASKEKERKKLGIGSGERKQIAKLCGTATKQKRITEQREKAIAKVNSGLCA